jgi:putative transcriptional regulator
VRGQFPSAPLLTAALCALVLVCAAPQPARPAESKPLTAILLVARSSLPDSFFSDSVVLVMNNLGPAPMGVIINRPTRIPVARVFPGLARLAELPDKVYFGGPVEPDVVWFLFRASKPPGEHTVQVFEGVYLGVDRDLLRRLLSRDKPMEGLKIFLGHSGWGPGQLESEIARGDWTLGHADSEAIFHGKSEHPWPGPEAQSSSPST